MKNFFLSRIVAVLITSISLLSCSKDSSLRSPAEPAKNDEINLSQKGLNQGFITGVLSPVPLEAWVTAYGNNGSISQVRPNPAGSFRIENLPGGEYNIVIQYIPDGVSPVDEKYSYHKIGGIRVSGTTGTDLGTVVLQ
ncbi:MAG: hypothetical protein ABL876_06125 [Chitinophagaceae bacterium]